MKRTSGTQSGAEKKVELKYCERCGGLWLRLAGDAEVYCMSCRREMTQLPRRVSRAARSLPDGDECEFWETEFDEAGGAA